MKKSKIDGIEPGRNEILNAIRAGRYCVKVLPTGYRNHFPIELKAGEMGGKRFVYHRQNQRFLLTMSLMECQVHHLRTFGDLRAVFKGKLFH